jgi:hypothetical protein
MLGGIFSAQSRFVALSDALTGLATGLKAERPMTKRPPPGSSPAWAVPIRIPASIVRRDPRPHLPRPWLRFYKPKSSKPRLWKIAGGAESPTDGQRTARPRGFAHRPEDLSPAEPDPATR